MINLNAEFIVLRIKIYVGKSINIYKRIKQHITQLNHKSKDENYHLIQA